MKAADIPDDAFLDAVRFWNAHGFPYVSRWNVGLAFPDAPEKVVLAKARKLIKRGLLEGCGCGCRGDFRLPEDDT